MFSGCAIVLTLESDAIALFLGIRGRSSRSSDCCKCGRQRAGKRQGDDAVFHGFISVTKRAVIGLQRRLRRPLAQRYTGFGDFFPKAPLPFFRLQGKTLTGQGFCLAAGIIYG
jgi:hypothetical protein